MKKTVFALSLISCAFLIGCDEKNSRHTPCNAENVQAEYIIPAIQTKNVVLFEKEEEIAVEDPTYLAEVAQEIKDKNSEEWKARTQTPINYAISTLKTQSDWLNELLLRQLFDIVSTEGKTITTQAEFLSAIKENYAQDVALLKESREFGIDFNVETNFIGQRENIATFTRYLYVYTGGAHGNYQTQYLNIDLNKKSLITLNDLFSEVNQKNVRELLWKAYQNDSRDYQGNLVDPFTDKSDFNVPNNFYFSLNGIHFVYNTYEIGSFAEGEKELMLSWYELNPLLNPPFQKKLKARELE